MQLTRLNGRCLTELASQWWKVSLPSWLASTHRWAVSRGATINERSGSLFDWIVIQQCLTNLPEQGELCFCPFPREAESSQRLFSPLGCLWSTCHYCCGSEMDQSDCRTQLGVWWRGKVRHNKSFNSFRLQNFTDFYLFRLCTMWVNVVIGIRSLGFLDNCSISCHDTFPPRDDRPLHVLSTEYKCPSLRPVENEDAVLE